jgi:hypothetical protein
VFYREGSDGELEKLTIVEYAKWQKEQPEEYAAEHCVAKETVNGLHVSTVCLFIDHSFGQGAPVIYETLVFDWRRGDSTSFSEITGERYRTRAEAAEGHVRFVARVKNGEIVPPDLEPSEVLDVAAEQV